MHLFYCTSMVRQTGLEPVRQGHKPLKRACLPIPALPHLLFFSLNFSFRSCSVSFSLIIIAFIFSVVKTFFQKNSTIYKYTYRILICIYQSSAIDKSVRRYNSSAGQDILKNRHKKRTSLRSPLIICVNSGLLELNRSASSLKLCLDLLSVSL